MKKIGVGIIGVTPGRSWAAIAHIPALKELPDYEIAALSTTRMESAKEAARAFDVPHFFDNHQDLVADPTVDLVAVTVKVPYHRELVTAALDAGKMVYCEWPLGNGLDEAIELTAQAKKKGIANAIGLQARSSPTINYIRDLIRDGFVGEVLSTTLVGSGFNWGGVIDNVNSYSADKKNGATLLTIPFGHTVDALCYCLGEFRSLAATTAVRRSSFTVPETGQAHPMTAEDQVAVSGVLDGGAVAAVHYRGGMSRGTNLLWEINGTAGDLQITAMAGHAQMFDLTVRGGSGAQQTLEPMAVPQKYYLAPAGLQSFARNVGEAYARFAADRRSGTHSCPDFDIAVRRHRMIASVDAAAETGRTVELSA